MLANKFDERRWIRLPVFWEPFEILEHSVYSRCSEQRDGVLGVLVKIGVEDSLIHEVLVLADVEEHPPQIVELERREQVGRSLQRLLDCLSVFADHLLCSGLGLRNDRKAITRGTFRITGPYLPCSSLKYPSFGMAIARGFVQSFSVALVPVFDCAGSRCCLACVAIFPSRVARSGLS